MLSQVDNYELIEHVQTVSGIGYYHARDRESGEESLLLLIDARRGVSSRAQIDEFAARAKDLDIALSVLWVHQDIAPLRGPLQNTLGVAYTYGAGIPLELWRMRYGEATQYDAVEFALALLDVLAFAHDRGVLHRSLSPHVVWVQDAPTLRLQTVYGFGVATLLGTEHAWSQTATIQADVRFMAPEQFTGEALSEATDLYAVGLLMHHVLSDVPAVSGDSLFAQIQAHCDARLAPISPDMRASSSLRAIVKRAIERHAVDRYVHAREMVHALREESQRATRILPQLDATRSQFSPSGIAPSAAPLPSKAEASRVPQGRGLRSKQSSRQNPKGHARAVDLAARQHEAYSASSGVDDRAARERTHAHFPWRVLLGAWIAAMLLGGGALWFVYDRSPQPQDEVADADLSEMVPPHTCRWDNVTRSLAVGETAFTLAAEHEIVLSYDRMTIRAFDRSRDEERPLRYIRAFGSAQLWHRRTVESAHDWLFIVPQVRHAQRPSIWVLQFAHGELQTSQRIPLSTETIEHVRVDLRLRGGRCMLWVRVEGDRGQGPPDKEAWFRMTDPGIVVEYGALGGLWAPPIDHSPL